ncbi:MAG: FAD-dependent thymidylate synthase [Gammaproteobacteria bacterium]|nr:FAD-dependent thymidylate synthase [Gammaproteobacteria bacterium]MBU1476984.1 FAD-dependent thymidylate synthase [Gammaproteobacteria bacterium]MBU2003552.1 FAD-dependent thymidylate synthase [Gammaproteobacteria bacterium]MBU2133071.1 FAD-dependent thymidylate synthase [Gammaproteobacteria bacterium]MBU2187990.1 FAD-dependent thymidylate synthase [Gammaproteobacteria bacterium]
MIQTSELKIFEISKPNFNASAFEEFLQQEGFIWNRSSDNEIEELVEAAGRVCYMSFGDGRQSPRDNSEYIANLIKQGHESVLEHVNWTFVITGVSRGFTHQLVRHRVGFAYSQLSQQYHDESEARFVVPPTIKNKPDLYCSWVKQVESSLNLYRDLLSQIDENAKNHQFDKKESLRELRTSARSVLPNCTETKIVVTVNARALRHFFKMRGALDGDYEMRNVSSELYKIVSIESPALFQDFKLVELKDGSSKLLHTK